MATAVHFLVKRSLERQAVMGVSVFLPVSNNYFLVAAGSLSSSVCWHQHLRRSIKIPADFVVRLLRIPRGGLISRYSQLWLGFLVSAIYHHAGAYMIHRNSGSMYFLWFCQAAMITIEDFVIWLGGKVGIKKNSKCTSATEMRIS